METSTAWAPSDEVLMSWSPSLTFLSKVQLASVSTNSYWQVPLTTLGPPAWSKQWAAVRTVVWSSSVPPHWTWVRYSTKGNLCCGRLSKTILRFLSEEFSSWDFWIDIFSLLVLTFTENRLLKVFLVPRTTAHGQSPCLELFLSLNCVLPIFAC